MSGSDGPVSGPFDSYGSDPTDDDCASIRLGRALEGPVLGVADQLTVTEIVNIVLRRAPFEIVAVVNDVGQDVGGILPTERLLTCLRRGVRFVGEIRSIDGGAIDLEVRMQTCDTIREFRTVEFTVPVFAGSAFVGQTLGVEPVDGLRPQVRIVDDVSGIVGTVDVWPELVDCLRRGRNGVAEINALSGRIAQVKIRIAP